MTLGMVLLKMSLVLLVVAVKHMLWKSEGHQFTGLLTWDTAIIKHDYWRLFFCKLKHFKQNGCNSIQIHLTKDNSTSQTSGLKAGNLNTVSLYNNLINAIWFPKKIVTLESRITLRIFRTWDITSSRHTNNKWWSNTIA